MVSTDNILFWQTLLGLELSTKKAHALLESLKDEKSNALTALVNSPLLSSYEKKRIHQIKTLELEVLLKKGIDLLFPKDYPDTLLQLEYPPVCLYYWGNKKILNAPKIGIVGTRKASSYGKNITKRFASELAKAGICIVSGGALGIDTAAHESTLEAGGATVAILPTGIETAYPIQNAALFKQIQENGCLLSPFAVGCKWYDSRPLVRNQLIAAICDAVIVIEAPQKSGALSTAHVCAELGKEVFVVPANLDYITFQGSLQLLKEGATLIIEPAQILETLGASPFIPEILELDQEELALVKIIQQGDSTLEKMIQNNMLSHAKTLATLTQLELKGIINRNMEGYILTRKI